MRLLELEQGQGFAEVDDEDYDRLRRYRWTLDRNGYPIRSDVTYRDRKRIVVYLEHLVLPKAPNPRAIYVDHIDGNPLNAQRSNLRYATNSQNQANRRKVVSPTGYKGVTRLRWGRYQAQIKCAGRGYYLGSHATPEAAARAYAKKGAELFGEFFWHNAPPDPDAEPGPEAA